MSTGGSFQSISNARFHTGIITVTFFVCLQSVSCTAAMSRFRILPLQKLIAGKNFPIHSDMIQNGCFHVHKYATDCSIVVLYTFILCMYSKTHIQFYDLCQRILPGFGECW
jgi:hypothetical protein